MSQMISNLDDLLYGYFTNRFYSLKMTGGDWWSFNDPFGTAKDGSSRVNFTLRRVMDWRTGLSEDIISYIQLVEELTNYAETLEFLGYNITPQPKPLYIAPIRPLVTELPASLELDVETKDRFILRGREYLINRGFLVDFLVSKGVKLCVQGRYSGRVLIPFLDEGGNCEYFTARTYINDTPKYLNPKVGETTKSHSKVLYGMEYLNEPHIYLVEGIMCAWTLQQQGYPAIATQGWELSEAKKRLLYSSNAEKITVFADKGYFRKSLIQYMFLKDRDLRVVNFDNLGDGLIDVNDIGASSAIQLASATNRVSIKTLINGK